jgi:hypothetical protein
VRRSTSFGTNFEIERVLTSPGESLSSFISILVCYKPLTLIVELPPSALVYGVHTISSKKEKLRPNPACKSMFQNFFHLFENFVLQISEKDGETPKHKNAYES